MYEIRRVKSLQLREDFKAIAELLEELQIENDFEFALKT